jgi:hypothetical protein
VIQSVIVKKHWLALGFAMATAPAIHAQIPIGELYSSDASVRGAVSVSVNGTRVLNGSQITAGDGVALLKLDRGGDVRICPQTNLSFSVDESGKTLVLGMNAGAMELNYSLHNASDSLVTPDFRLQLISPGTFHLAISVGVSGDTCLHSLPGNDAAVFVTEMMGAESYQLSPGKNVLFRMGKISGASEAPASCGCPVEKAGIRANIPTPAPKPAPAPAAETAPPVKKEAEPHLEVESSFVYRGTEAVQDYYSSVARLSLSTDNSKLTLALLPRVTGPTGEVAVPEKKKGVLRRFGHFMGKLFGK